MDATTQMSRAWAKYIEMQACIAPHCVLCTLEMKADEPIIFSKLLFCIKEINTDEALVASSKEEPIRFQRGTYYPCVITNCQHVDGLALACHSTCAAEGLPSWKTLEVTIWDPGFELPIAQSADLKRHLASKRASRRDLVRSTLQAKEKMVEASSGQVETSSRIWATYVKLHGETYVSALSNNHGEDLVYDPGSKATEDVIYVRRGPLGVKRIVVACSTETLEMENHPLDWWQVLPLVEDSVLHFEFDVSRHCVLSLHQLQSSWRVLIYQGTQTPQYSRSRTRSLSTGIMVCPVLSKRSHPFYCDTLIEAI